MIPVLELRGTDLLASSIQAESLADAAAYEPENGVYLVARTYRGGQELLLDEHMDRMERSAAALGHSLTVPRERIRRILADMRVDAGFQEGRFRVTAVLDDRVWYRLSMEPTRELPPDLRSHGVHCILWEGGAREDASVKSTAWMHARAQPTAQGGGEARTPTAGGAPPYERLLTDADGRVLEGTSSNVYFVMGGVLWTAGEGVLAGIARRLILEVAPPIVPVRLEALRQEELAGADEAFLSSATRGVVPIRSVDAVVYGDPGPVTRAIAEAYDRRVTALVRPLVRR